MPFKKGQSGNPNGRRKENSELTDLARKWTNEAMERLAYWMRSENAKASVAASSIILDRAYGKAQQTIDLTVVEQPQARVFPLGLDEQHRLPPTSEAVDSIH